LELKDQPKVVCFHLNCTPYLLVLIVRLVKLT
jgi:hypothetical protein